MVDQLAVLKSEPPMDARMLRTRAALQTALLALIEHKGFEQISIRDIVAQAGIGYATFFRHYASKEALLEDVAAAEIRALFALTLPALSAGGNRASASALCHYVDGKRGIWTSLLTGGAAAVMREEFLRGARDIGSQQAGNVVGWLPTELGVLFGVSGAFEILAWWLRQPADYPADRVAEFLDRLVITPAMSARAGLEKLSV